MVRPAVLVMEQVADAWTQSALGLRYPSIRFDGACYRYFRPPLTQAKLLCRSILSEQLNLYVVDPAVFQDVVEIA